MITPRLVVSLGLSQLVCWGVSYYPIGVFGEQMARDLGWSMTLTYSGFSVALVVMGVASAFAGRLIDRYGGRRVMVGGSLLLAVGCLCLSRSHDLFSYSMSWACLGLAMRLTLYEAAFAALARIGGRSARRAISQITLFGGLASTAFWPVGHALALAIGWRSTLVVYAAFALLTVPLHWSIPDHRHAPRASDETARIAPLAQGRADHFLAGSLYMIVTTLSAFLNSGMSVHMIAIMTGLGTSAGAAVWLSTLRGIGQSGARLFEVTFGGKLSPLTLGVLATGVMPTCFIAGLFSGVSIFAGAAFALAYGAGNGLLTIVRGAQPLVLFDHRSYGALVGRLAAPSFFVSALAPIAYARLIETAGDAAALHLSAALAGVVFACAALLWRRFRSRNEARNGVASDKRFRCVD
jgi:MFS family permease